jgi:hypothetical protein
MLRRSMPRATGVASIVALVVSGCGTGATPLEVPDLWRTQIDQLLTGDGLPITDVHRTILSDYAITDAEYGELRQDLSDCLTAHGIDHKLSPDGVLETTSAEVDDVATSELTDECMFSTTGPVESIYFGMQENPEGIGQGESMRRCLDAADVVEFAGVSADDLERLISAAGLEPTTPEALVCLIDPFGSYGTTVDSARQMLVEDQSEVVSP